MNLLHPAGAQAGGHLLKSGLPGLDPLEAQIEWRLLVGVRALLVLRLRPLEHPGLPG